MWHRSGFQPNADLVNINGRANTRFLTDVIGSYTTLGNLAWIGLSLVTFKPQFLLGIVPGRNDLILEFNCKAQPVNASTQIYKGKITYRKKILWLVNVNTTITDRTRNANSTVLAIDGTPGGMYDTEFSLANQNFTNWAIKYSLTASNIPHFNFIPTPSSLDIGGGNTALTLANYQARYVGATPPPPPLNSPFANFTTAFNNGVINSAGSANNNEHHIQIATRNGNFVAAELNAAPIVTNCSFICSNNSITITGPATVCNTASLFTINNFPAGVTATWQSIPAGIVNIVPIGNGSQANVTRVSSGYFTLRATINAPNCGSLDVNSATIRAGGFSSSDYPVSGPSTACTNAQVSYSTNTLQGATSYTWFWPSTSWTYISGQNTPSITLQTGSIAGSGQVGVRVANACDAGGSPGIKFTQVNSCGFAFSASPNPAGDQVTIDAANQLVSAQTDNRVEKQKIYKIEIIDQVGNKRKEFEFKQGTSNTTLNIADLPSGLYTLRAFNGTVWSGKQLLKN